MSELRLQNSFQPAGVANAIMKLIREEVNVIPATTLVETLLDKLAANDLYTKLHRSKFGDIHQEETCRRNGFHAVRVRTQEGESTIITRRSTGFSVFINLKEEDVYTGDAFRELVNDGHISDFAFDHHDKDETHEAWKVAYETIGHFEHGFKNVRRWVNEQHLVSDWMAEELTKVNAQVTTICEHYHLWSRDNNVPLYQDLELTWIAWEYWCEHDGGIVRPTYTVLEKANHYEQTFAGVTE